MDILVSLVPDPTPRTTVRPDGRNTIIARTVEYGYGRSHVIFDLMALASVLGRLGARCWVAWALVCGLAGTRAVPPPVVPKRPPESIVLVPSPLAVFPQRRASARRALALACCAALADGALAAGSPVQQMLTPEPATLPSESTEDALEGVEDTRGGRQFAKPQSAMPLLLRVLLRPGAAQVALAATIGSYVLQLKLGPALLLAGARDASKVLLGEEWHRLITSCFLHTDPIHLFRTCVFGLSRLMPTVAAIYGDTQCLLLYLLAGAGGNAASLVVGGQNAPPCAAEDSSPKMARCPFGFNAAAAAQLS